MDQESIKGTRFRRVWADEYSDQSLGMREGINFSRLHAMHPFKRSEGKGKLETFRTQKLLKYWYPVDSPKVVRLQNTVTTLSGRLLLV